MSEWDTYAPIISTVVGLGVWLVVIRKAVRERASLPLLALVLIIAGLIFAQALALARVPTPGGWSFIIVGILLLALWPRHGKTHTCPMCGLAHSGVREVLDDEDAG
jgi:hypothetical protein